MLTPLTQTVRFSFITPNEEPHIFSVAPIGWDEIEQDIVRSEKTDGIVLDITQNVKFIRKERAFLKNQKKTYGVQAKVEFVKEEKIFNDYEIVSSNFLEMKTIEIEKMTATASFVSNDFDDILRSNSKEKFEFNRITDINNNSISTLVPEIMSFKSRNIFLRSELELENPYTSAISLPDSTTHISIPVIRTINSDERVKETYLNSDNSTITVPFNGVNILPQIQQMFYFGNDREKILKVSVDVAFTFLFENELDTSEQIIKFHIMKSLTNGDPVELFTLGQVQGSGVFETQTFTFDNKTNPLEIEMVESDCLTFVIEVPQIVDNQYDNEIKPTLNNILVTEDSFFDPPNIEHRFVDCITLYDAFKRVIEIIDPNVIFKSTHILENWANVVLFSGETARHVLYDGENAVIGTMSFDALFKFLFTLNPVAFGIRVKGLKTIIEVEEIKYFFDDEVAIELSSLADIKKTINADKVYSRIEIGYGKSGINEDIFGLQATHTVNTFGTPVTTEENTYNAVCDVRTDPNELELCYRKQYSLFPERDTRYDKDMFAVDCKLGTALTDLYVVREWQDDFDSVEGIFSPNTAYNYRLSPMNCLLRHGSNFKQELINKAYEGKSILYLSTKGNVALKTQITGGDLIQEKDNVLLSVLGAPIFTSDWIEGTAKKTRKIVGQINGGYEKQNYYKTVSYIGDKGLKEYAYVYSLKIGNDIKTALAQKYGF